jgi:hypothetical protein
VKEDVVACHGDMVEPVKPSVADKSGSNKAKVASILV